SEVAAMLLDSWASYSPGVRREVIEALFARADRLPQLLEAIQKQKVLAGQLEPFRVERLRNHPIRSCAKRRESSWPGKNSRTVAGSWRLTGPLCSSKAMLRAARW